VTVAFTVTDPDRFHYDNVPALSAVLVQPSFGKASHHPGLSATLQPRFSSLRLPAFPKTKIVVEIEDICECGGITIHKLSQRRLAAD
jgi:hypothetical protein